MSEPTQCGEINKGSHGVVAKKFKRVYNARQVMKDRMKKAAKKVSVSLHNAIQLTKAGL